MPYKELEAMLLGAIKSLVKALEATSYWTAGQYGADGVGTVGNASCGDIMQIFIKTNGDKIVEAKFKTFGCGAAIATSSILTERIIGATLDEALKISEETSQEVLAQLRKEKVPCFTLATDALKLAIEEYRCNRRGFTKKAALI